MSDCAVVWIRDDFRIRDNQLQQVVDAPITHASFSITFVPEVTQSISITNFRSYVNG